MGLVFYRVAGRRGVPRNNRCRCCRPCRLCLTAQPTPLEAAPMADLQESLKNTRCDKHSRRDAGAPSQSDGVTSVITLR